MSTVVDVKACDLRKCLQYLNPLFPKGTIEVPLGVNLSKGVLTITCQTSCIFQAKLQCDSEDAASCTVIYFSTICNILPSEGFISFEFIPSGLLLTGTDFEVTLPLGYSTIGVYDFGEHYYQNIVSKDYISTCTSILNMGLDKLYAKPKPISIHKDISVLKYPNTWVQIRSIGLPFACMLDPAHLQMLCKFEPTKVSSDEHDALILVNDYATVKMPCKSDIEDSKIKDFVYKCDKVVNVNLEGYLDKLRSASKFDAKLKCRITLYEEGVKTTLSLSNVTMSVGSGNLQSKVLTTFHLPLQVWLSFVKALGNGLVQLLYGGDIICMRNQSLIILTRAVP